MVRFFFCEVEIAIQLIIQMLFNSINAVNLIELVITLKRNLDEKTYTDHCDFNGSSIYSSL